MIYNFSFGSVLHHISLDKYRRAENWLNFLYYMYYRATIAPAMSTRTKRDICLIWLVLLYIILSSSDSALSFSSFPFRALNKKLKSMRSTCRCRSLLWPTNLNFSFRRGSVDGSESNITTHLMTEWVTIFLDHMEYWLSAGWQKLRDRETAGLR